MARVRPADAGRIFAKAAEFTIADNAHFISSVSVNLRDFVAKMAMPGLILLVDADRIALRQTSSLLSEAGYLVASVSSFETAKKLLNSISPDLLVTAIRLDAFNGLHLAARSRIDHPSLPVILTHDAHEPVLEGEARRQNALFIVNPRENADFLLRVNEALVEHRQKQPVIRRWPRKQISGVLEAQLSASEARIFDISYGGLRLAFGGDASQLQTVFDVTFPAVGLTVKARSVWTYRSSAADEVWCGAELVDTGPPATTDWRNFVDSTF